jgi:site-specific DNA recombinase
VARPREEWISHVDESPRIISDDLWERVVHRTRPGRNEVRLKAGGKPKYLLSGLLRCDVCDAHYTITNATSYGCSSYHDGHACSNSILVRRDNAESILLGPIRDDLLKPDRVARMAKEMQDYFSDRMRSMQAQAVELPRDLQELAARIARLRERLKSGDPDMPADELQAAIDRAEAKRRDLRDQQPGSTVPMSKALALMPRAAELYRRQVALGLDGNPQAAQKARLFLREWFGGNIRLEPLADGGLMAHWDQRTSARSSAPA